jgi:hypothetical protein
LVLAAVKALLHHLFLLNLARLLQLHWLFQQEAALPQVTLRGLAAL